MSRAVNVTANDSGFIPGNLYLFCIQHGLRNISGPVIVSPGGCTVGLSGLRPIGSACSTSGCIPFQFLSRYTVTLWNNLPTAVVLSPFVDSFKNHVAAVRLITSTNRVYSFLFLICTELVTVRPAVFIYSYTHVVCTVRYCKCSSMFVFLFDVSSLCGAHLLVTRAPWTMHYDTH